jgi:hypothetical protein
LNPVFGLLRWLARPWAEGGVILVGSLWIAVALTLISGANYVWACRGLLKSK